MTFLRTLSSSIAIACVVVSANAQTLELTSDDDVPIIAAQTVNVGEHVRLKLRVVSPSTTFTNPQWIITGPHMKDWITKDGEAVDMALSDFLASELHVLWRDVTAPATPNIVHASVLAGDSVLTATASFNVVRDEKPEKFYSDDLLMENHNNWHSVYMFYDETARRGDLFLAWHRSQLDYFNRWRVFFGYPLLSNWDPATPWVVSSPPAPAKQHPSTTVVPMDAFSHRHNLITLDLDDQGYRHTFEGEYDRVTASQSRGHRPLFVSADYVLKMETVKQVLCGPLPCPDGELTATGTAVLPSWWKTVVGPDDDPWFAAGCPDFNSPTTCTASSKKSLEDYTLRELGESIESGTYRTDFDINYHALAHIAASPDMENPVTSMRDPIFWAWHSHLDWILSQWQAIRGAEATSPLFVYSKPVFNTGFTAVVVSFSVEVIEEFVLPSNVAVNGSRATMVSNVSVTPGDTYSFEFSGFAVPPPGPVELVVRREVNNSIRTVLSDPRPSPTLLASTYGQVLTPSVNYFYYTKP